MGEDLIWRHAEEATGRAMVLSSLKYVFGLYCALGLDTAGIYHVYDDGEVRKIQVLSRSKAREPP